MRSTDSAGDSFLMKRSIHSSDFVGRTSHLPWSHSHGDAMRIHQPCIRAPLLGADHDFLFELPGRSQGGGALNQDAGCRRSGTLG
jgi:hypothetical protein